VKRPALELADIFRKHAPAFLGAFGDSLSRDQKKALRDISVCRTAALGGYVEQCDRCGHRQIAYRSCRNRHCPKCQAATRAVWLEQQASLLLPVEYFHVVFTVPQSIAPLALQNQRVVYGILFRAASETLLQLAADPKRLGAQIGFLAVLHTWGQNLHAHPHLHCVVPGGGISRDRSRWISARKRFFLPVKVLSRLFRGKFVAYLKQAFQQGRLGFHGKIEALGERGRFLAWLDGLARSEWVVYAKPPFGGPQQVLKYLARYTHRVAISNQRLISLQNGQVTFQWKDYARGNRTGTMTLAAHEFIRRFLLHVLPRGFVKIRHFGFLANRCRQREIALCRKLLDQESTTESSGACSHSDLTPARPKPESADRCPVCRQGRMNRVEMVTPRSPPLDWDGAGFSTSPTKMDA
jgi:Putative transposase/Transposase zinc-binding domain